MRPSATSAPHTKSTVGSSLLRIPLAVRDYDAVTEKKRCQILETIGRTINTNGAFTGLLSPIWTIPASVWRLLYGTTTPSLDKIDGLGWAEAVKLSEHLRSLDWVAVTNANDTRISLAFAVRDNDAIPKGILLSFGKVRVNCCKTYGALTGSLSVIVTIPESA